MYWLILKVSVGSPSAGKRVQCKRDPSLNENLTAVRVMDFTALNNNSRSHPNSSINNLSRDMAHKLFSQS